jgi:hypothetical protein
VTTRVDDGHRRLVPRWRYSKTTILGREHEGDPNTLREAPRLFSRINELQDEWNKSRNMIAAREFVAAAVVDSHPEVARDAAHYLLTNEDPRAIELIGSARFVLGERATTDLHPHIATESYLKPMSDARQIIGRGRQGLREYPRNVLRRLDVARAYAIVGQGDAAWRHMRIALALAPQDRIVLRLKGPTGYRRSRVAAWSSNRACRLSRLRSFGKWGTQARKEATKVELGRSE